MEITNATNPDLREIAKRHTTYKTFDEGLDLVLEGKAIIVGSKALSNYAIKQRFTSK